MPSIQAEDNKALVLAAFEALFNRRDYQAAERFWSPDYILRGAAPAQRHREALTALGDAARPSTRAALVPSAVGCD